MAAPTAFEQEMLELINRARANPAGEFDAIITDQATATAVTNDITQALKFFNVDLALFKSQMVAFGSVAPLAWNDALNNAAKAHSSLMIAQDTQSHQLVGEPSLGDRVTAAGYSWSNLGENVYAFSEGPVHSHAGFIVDWGFGPGGIQDPAGHRISILSSKFTEVGIGAIAEANPATSVGPNVVTQNFGNRFDYKSQLVGSVFKDGDNDKFYDAGEGLGAVTITATGASGTFTTQSWDSGGYQLQVPAGSYTVTFSGGGLVAVQSKTFVMGSENVKVDAISGESTTPAETSMISIQGIYVALFGRPADPAGLAFFNTATGNGADLTQIGDLASTAEYNTRFNNKSNGEIITAIYQSLFDRDPETDGLNFFSGALTSGSLNINNIAIAILNGAQNADKTLVDKKITAADLFSAAIDTPSEVAAYSGSASATKGIAFVDAVSATSTVVVAAAAQAAVTALSAGANIARLTSSANDEDSPATVFEFADVDAVLITVANAIVENFTSEKDKFDFELTAGTEVNFLDGGVVSSPADGLTNANAVLDGTLQYFFVDDGANGHLYIDKDLDGTVDLAVNISGVTDMVYDDIIA